MMQQLLITLLGVVAGAAIMVVAWQSRTITRQAADFARLKTWGDELKASFDRAVGDIGELQQQRLPEKWHGAIRAVAVVALHIAQDERVSNRALAQADPEAHTEGDASEINYQWRQQQIATAARISTEELADWLAMADKEEGT